MRRCAQKADAAADKWLLAAETVRAAGVARVEERKARAGRLRAELEELRAWKPERVAADAAAMAKEGAA